MFTLHKNRYTYLKVLAMCTSLTSIFDWNNATIVQILLDWFSFGWDVRPSCSSSLPAAYINYIKLENYWLFNEILFRFSYILVISRASRGKLLQRGKNMVAICSFIQKVIWLFCVRSLDCDWLDLEIESVLEARRK